MKKVKIQSVEYATHDVLHIRTEKPQGISYLPGQAVDVSLNDPKWKDELRAFTFTSLPSDDYLEFFIKIYPKHKGVTAHIGKLKSNDALCIGDVFGDIQYKGEGIFIAGGAGITPFIAIIKDLEKQNKLGNNKLIFANKTSNDIIEQTFFSHLLNQNFINILSDEKREDYEYGYISKELLKQHIENPNIYFYLCGPTPMLDAVLQHLKDLGIDDSKIVQEQF